MRRGRRIAGAVAALVFACLLAGLLVSTQAGAALLLWALEHSSAPVRPEQLRGKVDAIAVLGGRTARIHEAARLTLATDVPLLLVGKGTGDSGFEAESEKMEDILLRQYGIGPRWVETESINTHQNAVFAWCLVGPMGVRKVALLTDPFHMPRARAEFAAAGFQVVPAPATDAFALPWRPRFTWAIESFVPGRAGWLAARRPVLEWGGAVAAFLRGAWPAPSPACGRGLG
ncbi:MAG: YdcF family protein [Ramlibacter sp.]|nr:YdcF family protein [Ramlibacter sp.]